MTDHPDDVSLAKELLEAEGWLVRDPTADESAPIAPPRHGLVVEVRLRGAKQGARRAAVRRVEKLAKDARLGLWVRHSVLLDGDTVK